MANKAFQLLRVLGLACHVVDGLALSLVSDARHMVGYDVVKPFEHVDGSACCLDFSVDAAELDSCKRICLESEGCGSFLFTSADRQCYLISQESNFEPVASPSGCERRCVEQEACEAFVFQSSSHLCFLIRFDERDPTGTILTASVRPAGDRIFGLVRDGVEGSIQAAISRSLLRAGKGNQSTAAELPSESLAAKDIVPVDATASRGDTYDCILGSAMAAATLASFLALLALLVQAGCASPRPRLLEVDIPHISSNPSLPQTQVSTPVVAAEATPQRRHTVSIPVSIPATTPPRDASAVLVVEVASTSPQAHMASPGASKDASLAVAEVGHGASAASVPSVPGAPTVTEIVRGVSPPKAAYKWRVREMVAVPAERRVSVAGITNYPVAGEASPFARSTPQKVLIRELVEDTGTPEESECAEAAEKPVHGVSKSKSIWVPEVVLMARLMLGALLLGVLTLERKTIGTIVFALLCLPSIWLAAKAHCSNSESCFEEVAVASRTDAESQSAHVQVLPGHNEESKQESQAPRLKRRLPPDLQVMQGGG